MQLPAHRWDVASAHATRPQAALGVRPPNHPIPQPPPRPVRKKAPRSTPGCRSRSIGIGTNAAAVFRSWSSLCSFCPGPAPMALLGHRWGAGIPFTSTPHCRGARSIAARLRRCLP